MKKLFFALYGVIAYGVFLFTFLYLIGFLANVVVPKSVDSGSTGPVATAVLVNLVLVALFGLQHSVMARPAFKQWWMRIVPKPIERSTYVLFTTIVLNLLYWQWRPIDGYLWQVESEALRATLWLVCASGWALVLVSTFLIDHFELFGLSQVIRHMRDVEPPAKGFVTPLFYQFVRHPLYLGFLIAFWTTPDMSYGHLLFAAATTAYILRAIPYEERDLTVALGQNYVAYKASTPKLIPRLARKPRPTKETRARPA